MQNKKSKTEIEKENKENFNNLSNCSSIQINTNMIFLKDSHNLLDSKIETENKKKMFILNKAEAEKKATQAKQILFHVKKNSRDYEANPKNMNSNPNNLNNLQNMNVRSMNTSKNSEFEANRVKSEKQFEISDNREINEIHKNFSEVSNEKENLNELNQLNQLQNPHLPQTRGNHIHIQQKPNQRDNRSEQNYSNDFIENFKLSESRQQSSIQNNTTNYLCRENSFLIKTYGSDSYHYIKQIENNSISKNFLYKHKINPEIRSKMVDWMIEVLAVYKSEAETFFLSVHLMDSFINHSNSILKSEDIHLLGVTCMFIATKFEDIIPIRISCFVNKISHGNFSEKQIKIKERKILEIVGFNRLITTSTYEFVKTYFFDFSYNNKKSLRRLKLEELVQKFEKAAIFLAKLTLHFECFYEYKHSCKAIACVITAFDLIKSNGKEIINEGERFLKEWESPYSSELIGDVYAKLVDYYKQYDRLTFISKNLTKYFPLELN